jgi:hypothetical protein
MTVFVVAEVEPEHAQTRTVVGIFGSFERAEVFVAQQHTALDSGQHSGFPTEKTNADLW